MGDRCVCLVQRERGDVEVAKVQQAGADQSYHVRHGFTRIHLFAAHGDVVAHDPRIRQVEPRAPEHADAAHQYDAPIRAHGHHRGTHRDGRGRRWQQIDHAIDRTGRRLAHPLAIFVLIAGESHCPNPFAETALQIRERALIAPGRDDTAQRGDRRDFARETVPPAIERLVANLNLPAYVTGRRWDILVWNSAAADLLGFDRLAPSARNILSFMFIETNSRRLFGRTWADEARRMVALFRATHDLHADDPAFVELVERVRSRSPEFVKWWTAHDVRGSTSGQKVLQHPKRGAQRYEYATFQANDDPALKLAIYTPL